MPGKCVSWSSLRAVRISMEPKFLVKLVRIDNSSVAAAGKIGPRLWIAWSQQELRIELVTQFTHTHAGNGCYS